MTGILHLLVLWHALLPGFVHQRPVPLMMHKGAEPKRRVAENSTNKAPNFISNPGTEADVPSISQCQVERLFREAHSRTLLFTFAEDCKNDNKQLSLRFTNKL